MDKNANGLVLIDEFVFAYYREQRFAKDKIAELELEKKRMEAQRQELTEKYRLHQ